MGRLPCVKKRDRSTWALQGCEGMFWDSSVPAFKDASPSQVKLHAPPSKAAVPHLLRSPLPPGSAQKATTEETLWKMHS